MMVPTLSASRSPGNKTTGKFVFNQEERSLSQQQRGLSLQQRPGQQSMPMNQSSNNGVNTFEEMFSICLKESINPQDSSVTTCWQYNIPNLSSSEKQLVLDFQGGEILILQAASPDFPQQIYIFCPQLSGYLSATGNATNKVAIYRIKSVIPLQTSGITTYTVIYELKDPQSWNLGLTRHVQFKVGDENGVYSLPLHSGVNVEFRILHVAF